MLVAVQIAKAQGAHVTTTCSTAKVDFVTKELGADVAVDYTKDRFDVVAPGPYDIVVDLIGGDYEVRSRPLIKKRGAFVNVLNSGFVNQQGMLKGSLSTAVAATRGLMGSVLRMGPKYHFLIMHHDADRGLKQISHLIEQGKFKPIIDRVVPLENVAQAHEYGETNRARGKIVLTVSQAAS